MVSHLHSGLMKVFLVVGPSACSRDFPVHVGHWHGQRTSCEVAFCICELLSVCSLTALVDACNRGDPGMWLYHSELSLFD